MGGPSIVPDPVSDAWWISGSTLPTARRFVAVSQQYLAVPDNAALSNSATGSLTVSLWFLVDHRDATQPLVAKASGTAGSGFEWYLNVLTNGTVRFAVSDGTTADLDVTTDTVTAGQWHHGLFEYDHGVGVKRFTLNGGTPRTAAYAGGLWDSEQEVWFGRLGSALYLDGRLASVGVWKSILTTDQKTWLAAGRRFAADLASAPDGSIATGASYWNGTEASGDMTEQINGYTAVDVNGVTSAAGPPLP